LILTRPGEEIRAMRNAATPSLTEWIHPATILLDAALPRGGDTDLAWDGTSIWQGDGSTISNYARQIDPATLAITDSVHFSIDSYGIEWVGTDLWTTHDGTQSIYRLDPATGDVVFTSAPIGSWGAGIASDGAGHLWVDSEGPRAPLEYDITTDAVIDS